MTDTVNNPKHYLSLGAKCSCGQEIECITITRHLNFNLGNAIKYIWRADHKGKRVEDLRKAIWYLNDEIKRLEQNNTTCKINISKDNNTLPIFGNWYCAVCKKTTEFPNYCECLQSEKSSNISSDTERR